MVCFVLRGPSFRFARSTTFSSDASLFYSAGYFVVLGTLIRNMSKSALSNKAICFVLRIGLVLCTKLVCPIVQGMLASYQKALCLVLQASLVLACPLFRLSVQFASFGPVSFYTAVFLVLHGRLSPSQGCQYRVARPSVLFYKVVCLVLQASLSRLTKWFVSSYNAQATVSVASKHSNSNIAIANIYNRV